MAGQKFVHIVTLSAQHVQRQMGEEPLEFQATIGVFSSQERAEKAAEGYMQYFQDEHNYDEAWEDIAIHTQIVAFDIPFHEYDPFMSVEIE